MQPASLLSTYRASPSDSLTFSIEGEYALCVSFFPALASTAGSPNVSGGADVS
jgi:hypothetical protein